MKKELSLLVMSCDEYSDVGRVFFHFQNKNMGWFKGEKFFVNETKEVDFQGVRVIHVGKEHDWSGKLSTAINSIESKYVLFMLEDYFITDIVREEHFEEALTVMREHKLKYYKISAIPSIKGTSKIADYLADIPSNLRYGINLQTAIFQKDFLMEIVSGKERSAWEVENDLLKTVTDKFEYNIEGCVLDKRNIINVHNGILKGKWFPDTKDLLLKEGIEFDFTTRGVLSKHELCKQHVKRFISQRVPTGVARKIKKVLKRLGCKFVTNN